MRLESDLVKLVLEYLELKRIFHWRNNTGALTTSKGGFVRFGAIGSPDIFALKSSKIYGIECKSSKGKQSSNQLEWQRNFEKAGGVYILLKELDVLFNYF